MSLAFNRVNEYYQAMSNKRVVWAGLAAGVLCHFMQGTAAYLFFDRFYLANPDIIRDSSHLVGIYYLFLNLIVGLVIAHLTYWLKAIWDEVDWLTGIKAALVIWAGSSPVWIIKRQILINLSNWLLLEIVADFIIYAVIGAVAGYLVGRGITEPGEEKP